MSGHRILLVEPGYRNKYPPLGLMKIAAYHGLEGRGDTVRFVKGENSEVLAEVWDRVYVTTLFSFEWTRTARAIDFAIRAAGGQNERVFVGGIAASLMHDDYVSEPRWSGVRFVKGLLDGPPATALMLSEDNCDFGADDVSSLPIERNVPDYGILDHIEYKYPVHDAYFGYASRGCVRKCSFCGVPALEGGLREMPPLSNLVHGIAQVHGPKKDLILMDNNVTASSRYKEIIAEIRDLGFVRGARVEANGTKPAVKRRVDFNQGVDARILAKSPMYLREMATICIDPLRIAFDHLGVRRVYETAINMAADNGITSLSNYMLYNFMDTPIDLYTRMALNIQLNESLGIRIWSFPMRYQPVTLRDRSHVGKNWNWYYLRSFQIMLQATHGVVSGNPAFFRRAFGEDQDRFLELLGMPHAFIFFREYYEAGGGTAVREEYEALRKRLTSSQRKELLGMVLGQHVHRGRDEFLRRTKDRQIDRQVRKILRFYALDTKERSKLEGQKILADTEDLAPGMPDAERRVEDAGLYDDGPATGGRLVALAT